MGEYVVTDTELTAVANAIRTKGGTSADLEWNADFISAINAISGGGGAKNILKGTDAPSASLGSNGDMYLQYIDVPSGYTLLDYIQSTGTQYIDTGVNPDSDTAVEVDFFDYSFNGDTFLYGYRPNSWNGGIGINNNGSTNMFLYFGGENNAGRILPMVDGKIKLENGKRTVNGSETAFTPVTISYNYPIYIFATNNNGAAAYFGSYKLRSLKIWDDDVLIRDFIPCKRDSDDVIGLYDLVNSTFYANSGTGSFTGGNEMVDDCIESVYLKVNGAWQSLIGQGIDDVNTEGGGTSDIDTSLLPNSDATKILMSQDDSIASVDHWGRLSLYDKNVTRANPITIGQDGAFQFAGDTFGTFHLSQANADVTVYALAKVITLSYGDLGILGITYNKSNGNSALFYTRYSAGFYINTSTYGNDTQTQYTIDNYALIVVSVNQTTKKARFFINGNYVDEKSFSNTGNQVIFNSFGLADTNTNVCAFKFMGIVDECESNATVIANMQHLMQEFNIGE